MNGLNKKYRITNKKSGNILSIFEHFFIRYSLPVPYQAGLLFISYFLAFIKFIFVYKALPEGEAKRVLRILIFEARQFAIFENGAQARAVQTEAE